MRGRGMLKDWETAPEKMKSYPLHQIWTIGIDLSLVVFAHHTLHIFPIKKFKL